MVKVKLRDHEEWQGRMRIEEGRNDPLLVDLKPIVKASTLSVSSVPSSATVFIDGVQKGRTPLKLKLQPDTYKVQVKLKRYQDWETQVELLESREYPLKVTLTKEPSRTRTSTTSQEPTRRSEPRTTQEPPSTGNEWGIGTYRDRRINQ
jgi:hypothetical protein